jgi:hypothetical protein
MDEQCADAPSRLIRTPGQGDFHGCGGVYVRRPDRRPGRVCGYCGRAEPGLRIRVRIPDGQHAWVRSHELFWRGA